MFRTIASGAAGAAVCVVLGLVEGCLTRPVAPTNPDTVTNFTTSIPAGAIDKVDLLFDIDNSASMGDKQAYLSQAVPDLITRLVQPNCLDDETQAITGTADTNGTCADPNSSPEFPPVHDMHIGILSSSLGNRLGDECLTQTQVTTMNADPAAAVQALPAGQGGPIDRHNDDQAHLLDRAALEPDASTHYEETTETAADDTTLGGGHFLDWFPTANPLNADSMPTGPTPIQTTGDLEGSFAAMVSGVHEFGCGIESQLETWYRFLIQPDPYASLTVDENGRAQWVGVDTTVLAQRADFLRPDSLLAILVLTDENDSEVDVRSFGGSGYQFMSTKFDPPTGTQVCSTDPASGDCQSCAFTGNAAVQADPTCHQNVGPDGYPVHTDPTDWGYDLNLRHVHEKQKYGASVQFPIQRYVIGLTSAKVPDRNGEYPPDTNGDGGYASSYQGLLAANQTCVNPLFAQNLPTPTDPGLLTAQTIPAATAKQLCNLAPGPRTPGLVYYAHIGGVPHQLLQQNPSDADSAQKDTLSEADWQLILGKDPENFDYTGIDPHMIESFQPRESANANLPAGASKVAAEGSAEGTDPISGHEWITNSMTPFHAAASVNREYACTFKLPTPRDCSEGAMNADPTLSDSCDCIAPSQGGTSYTQAQLPAVCNDKVQTTQDYAKAYPTIRELEVAHLLGQVSGANEGIVSSLCPIHTVEETPGDPLYGYRPAMTTIINVFKKSLNNQCLPQPLQITETAAADGGVAPTVPCLVLGTFPSGPNAPTNCAAVPGYQDAEPEVLAHFQEDQHGQWVQGGMSGTDPSTELTCELKQLTPNQTCKTGPDVGWCYMGPGSNRDCAQELLFNSGAIKFGVTMSLQCIESSTDAGAPGVGTPVTASDAGNPSD